MYDVPRNADDQAWWDGADEPLDAHTESERRQGFWSGLADVLLSIPAGVGIRIGG